MGQSTLIKTALTGAMAAGLVAMSSASVASVSGMEKCTGVAKAGKNDCGTSQHACAGMSKTDNDAEEWVYLPKGTCEKLAGGVLQSDKK